MFKLDTISARPVITGILAGLFLISGSSAAAIPPNAEVEGESTNSLVRPGLVNAVDGVPFTHVDLRTHPAPARERYIPLLPPGGGGGTPRSFGDTFDVAAMWFCGTGGGYLVNTGAGPGPCIGQTYDGLGSTCGTNVFSGANVVISESETDNGDGTVTVIVQIASGDGSDLLPPGFNCVGRGEDDDIDTIGGDLAKQDAGGPGVPGDSLEPDLGVSPFEILTADAVVLGAGGQVLLEFALNSTGTTRTDLKDRFTVSGVDQVTVTAMQFRYRIAVGEAAGACCLPTNPLPTCVDGLTGVECTTQGGQYFGDFSTCQSVPCGPPANDLCIDSITISTGNISFDTTDATLDSSAGAPCDPDMANDLWYHISVATSGLLRVATCGAGTGPDTILQLYRGQTCPPGQSAGCSDDAAGCGVGGLASFLELPVNAGEDFTIRLGGKGPPINGSLSVSITPTTTGGGCCRGAGSCVDVSGATACAGIGGTYLGAGVICGVNFQVPAQSTSTHFETCGSNYNTVLQIFDACGGVLLTQNDDCADTAAGGGGYPSAPCFDSNPGSGEQQSCTCLATTPGTNYFVRVTNFGETAPPPGANTSLFVQHGGPCAPLAAGACCINGICSDNVRPSNCQSAGGTYQGDGSSCNIIICSEPTGACCLANGNCLDSLTESDCLAVGEAWFGGATCEETACSGTDADGDGIEDNADNCPFVYNPNQEQIACSGHVIIDQVDWFGGDDTPTLLNSDYGMFGVTIPNPGEAVLFVNADIGGAWKIQNMPITGIDFVVTHPLQSYYTMFEIGQSGENVTGNVALVRVMVSIQPQLTGLPAAVSPGTVIIGSTPQQKGDAETVADSPPGPAAGAGVFERPAAPAPIERATRPGFNMVDLNEPSEQRACGPGAVASSFVWLNRTYCLGLLDDPDDPAGTKNIFLEEFKDLMGYSPTGASGVQSGDLFKAKKAYIARHRLPLRVEGKGRGLPTAGIDPAEIFKQMKLGQDVEIFIRFGGAATEDKGHYAPVVEMKKEGDKYTITTQDDGKQTQPGHTDRRLTGELVMEGADWFYTDALGKTKLVAWYAESPTRAAVNRAICDKAEALRLFIEGLGGTATADQANEILKRSNQIEYLARRLLDIVDCDPGSTAAQRAKALDMAVESLNLVELAELVIRDLLDPPSLAQQLSAARDKAAEIKDLSVEFKGLYPPDADFDDVPDSSDNAPNDANPDQADCQPDGIGDVLQLTGNDCNMNGIPDDCELAGNDCNNNNVPDECDIASGLTPDANGNGLPDVCEGDMNCDGVVDGRDVDAFVLAVTDPAAYEATYPDCNRLRGDFNGDGEVSDLDVASFAARLAAGGG